MNKAMKATLFVGGFLAVMISTADIAMAAKAAVKAGAKMPVAKVPAGRLVNDSLVKNLQCQNLNVDSIYSAIREDAYSEARNMDIVNWGYSAGGFALGNCWALSSTQRMMSYMARYNQPNSMGHQNRLEVVSNMVRRAVPAIQVEQASNEKGNRSSAQEKVVNRELKNYSVFPVEGDSLAGTYEFWWDLRAGYDMNLSRRYTVKRSLREDMQVNQTNHFFRGRNVGMGLGGGATSAKENYETLKVLMKNTKGKRLTLVNLRMARTVQHVVMVKSFTQNASGVTFVVYDSNQPTRDQELIYNTKTGVFTAPGISSALFESSKPLGVFIVDEQERQALEVALMKHYQAACK